MRRFSSAVFSLFIIVTVMFCLLRMMPLEGYLGPNLLPYLVSVIMLQTALAIPMVLSDEVFLTYCGLGMPKNKPSLGGLVEEGRKVMMSPSQRYQLIIPAVVVTFITVSFYLIGNAFADASDPRNHV